MNLKLKSLVAAVVLAASIPAHAAMDLGATAGNSSLVLTLLDTTDNISATFDLGQNYLDYNQVAAAGSVASLSNNAWNLAAGDYSTAWSTFFSSVTNQSNVVWAVTAADRLGTVTNNPSSLGYISTFAGTSASLSSSNLATAVANFDSYLTANNAPASNGATVYTNHDTVANGGSVANAGTAYANNIYLNGKLNNTGAVVTGSLGNALSVFQVVNAGANGLAASSPTVFGNGAQFLLNSNGGLTFTTAVPEADTSAMLLAGLGLMGFIARRRTQA